MKIAKNIYVIVCDDIRQEIDDRLSLIGVYQEKLVVDAIPTIIPKFSLLVTLEDTTMNLPKIDLIIKPFKGETKVLSFKAPSKNFIKGDNVRLIGLLSPFRVEAEGKVKIQIRISESDKAKTIHTFDIINRSVLD